MSCAAKLIRYKLGNSAPAVTRVARNSHSGAAGLTPFDGQRTEHMPIRCEVPANRNLPLPFGKRSVFCRLGRQLMKHRRRRLGSFRPE